jgi:hypothetical protein
MKKVFIVHGFEGSPNGGWRPWLMSELEKTKIYACALSMPTPEKPIWSEWVKEIGRHVEQNKKDQIYLVGHSLGVPAILRYLERTKSKNVKGAVLVSGPIYKTKKKAINNFFKTSFDHKAIRSKTKKFLVIHGDNDPNVPLEQGRELAQELKGKLIVVKNGGHLNGSSGWYSLPQCLDGLKEMVG